MFLAGDTDAFEELVAMYEDELSRFIYGIIHDYYETKHLVIETFAQLAIHGGKFAGKSSLKTYLFTIGKNTASRHLKLRGREQHLSFDEAVAIPIDEDETPERFVEREENKQRIHRTLQELKEEHRVVLALLYFEDLSYRQVGRAMNKSEQQIKQLAYRAKLALRKKLAEDGY